LPEADGYFFLPLDFSWIMKKLVQTLRPNLLILSEGDFWYHLLKESKKRGARCLLVNGKISARSASRFAKVSLFSKPLFRLLDHCCVQSFRYAERFYTLGIEKKKIAITGNLKLDSAQKSLTLEEKKEWKERLGATGRLIVIGSTHPKEEELLIAALKPLFAHFPDLKVVVAPRHPERFAALRAQFKEYGEQAILIDRMGILHELYQIADIAIVAGSFVPGARGHNIFEPMQFGIPTLFGSYMDSQLDLVALALDEQAAIQSSLHDLEKNILTLLQEKEKREALSERALRLSQEARGASLRTVNILESYLV
jgi:3-deoxy-D-manno-octulosonic-acid transferase